MTVSENRLYLSRLCEVSFDGKTVGAIEGFCRFLTLLLSCSLEKRTSVLCSAVADGGASCEEEDDWGSYDGLRMCAIGVQGISVAEKERRMAIGGLLVLLCITQHLEQEHSLCMPLNKRRSAFGHHKWLLIISFMQSSASYST